MAGASALKAFLERTPLHPVFMAAYPVVALLASNLGQVKPSVGDRAIVFSLLLAGGGWLAVWALSRDVRLGALLATWALLLFYSYGHVYNALRTLEVGGEVLGRHRYLLPVWLVLAVLGSLWVWRGPGSSPRLNVGLNIALGLALLIPLSQVLLFRLDRGAANAARTDLASVSLPLETADGGPPPDVYYLLLDAYTSADVLQASFYLDNRPFIEAQEALGFYVADCSYSNYSQTELSLVATLNMAYLSDLIDESLAGDQPRAQLWPLLRHPMIRRMLEESGYQTVAFETGYYWSEWEDADRYLAPQRGPFEGLSAFEATLLRSTAAWALVDALPQLPAFLLRDLDRSAEAHRERLLFVFEQLEGMPDLPGPKFVFAHIVSPHRPFVFDAQGNPVDDDYDWSPSDLGAEAYRRGYREQVQYLNARLLPILRNIVERSDPRPIVVVQGDHGPEEGSSQDRMRVLNALYLGRSRGEALYPNLSPVNTFRLVLNAGFDAGLDSLEDVSRFSTYDAPFDYSHVADTCSG